MSYTKEKEVALAATTAAAKLCQQIRQHQATQTIAKADASPVTVADFGAQAIICQFLAAAFPQDSAIAEENATMLQQPELSSHLTAITKQVQTIIPNADKNKVIDWINWGNGSMAACGEPSRTERYWTLDPIDGTKGYIRGDQYAIALALVEEGEVKLGILGCPALPLDGNAPEGEKGVLFLGVKGEGTRAIALNTKKTQEVRVNQFTNAESFQLIESVESAHSDRDAQQALANLLGFTRTPKKMDSEAKYGAVARGEADLYVRIPIPSAANRKDNIWDHAAGVIVLEEAGGCVTDLDGKVLDFGVGAKLLNNRGIVASLGGEIHQRIVKAISTIN